MEMTQTLDGILFSRMVNAGAANLKAHAAEVNQLNVFPIPDGDTGDNMLLTMMGGVHTEDCSCERLCKMAEKVSGGMLLSARGNSGVILSQFFEGIKNGFAGLHTADTKAVGEAFRQGVAQAYRSVMSPAEGTILTVAREATEYACSQEARSPGAFLNAFITEAKQSLARTPELLPVLKKAGVVDSGAAGLIYIVDGMMQAIRGENIGEISAFSEAVQEPDLDAFDENSVLEFGYCTELLLRLQNAKVELSAFDLDELTAFLQTVGDSIVTVHNGSLVKLHVHTKTPDQVLAFCQRYGEFLKVKIENMSLQHNNTMIGNESEQEKRPIRQRLKYGVIAVANGTGVKNLFSERGADVIVDGGQSMNPSAEAFIEAFDAVNADTVFVLPNNGNSILAAKQAAKLYDKSDVRVIESRTIGDGYAALSMLDTGSGDTDAIVSELTNAMQGVVTAEISRCVRDVDSYGTEMHTGDYIGFVGKELLAVNANRFRTLCDTIEKLNPSQYDICILICGKDASDEEARAFEAYIHGRYIGKEVYIMNGDQDIYDYIMILE